MTSKINNIIKQITDFCNNVNISIKHLFLLLITIVSLFLILLGLSGLDFGIIALICWTFAFLDLARIKFKDFEIEFMTHKQVITADERKLYIENYNLMEKFMFEFLKDYQVNDEAFNCISKATRDAYLFLNFDLAKKLDEYCTIARQAYILNKRVKLLEEQNLDTTKYQNKVNDDLFKLHDINLVELYRPYVKVKDYEE
jgi:hypothetical protein